MNTSQSRLR